MVMNYKDITNYQRSDNYNKVNLWKIYWVFSLVNIRQWMKQNSKWVSILTDIILPRIYLLRRCGHFDFKGHRFSLDRKTTAGEFLVQSWFDSVEKKQLFYDKEISGSDDEAIAYCFVDHRQGSIQEWTGKKGSIKTLFLMRNNLSWGTGERKDVFLCLGIIYWG